MVELNTVGQDSINLKFHEFYANRIAEISKEDYVAEPGRLMAFLEEQQTHIPALLWIHLVDIIVIMVELGPWGCR